VRLALKPLGTLLALPGKVSNLIIILKSDVTETQIQHIITRVEALELRAHLSQGTFRTIIGVIGDEEKLLDAPLTAIPGVAEVIPVLPSTNWPA